MTERASPLPTAHRVRLDCTCDGAVCTWMEQIALAIEQLTPAIGQIALAIEQIVLFSPHTITYYRPSPPLHPVYGKAITGRGALRGT